jgi:hypothetical protein
MFKNRSNKVDGSAFLDSKALFLSKIAPINVGFFLPSEPDAAPVEIKGLDLDPVLYSSHSLGSEDSR